MDQTNPPRVLYGASVLAYAEVDDSIEYVERGCFFVNGKLLGPVPRLAICKLPDETEILVEHCDSEWNSLGVQGGFRTVEEAKARVERSYQGLMNKWIDTEEPGDKA
ncbi:hypothetical protein KP003_17205 [Geomonas nitrogeniifigens]|uniref:hypothetical protein n=1 Tax=Geomonas diazotrophica TaxID=2843197 RepID=UPI001C2B9D10|nr:hypothetical protein [Geomonas nitrogeniifigens]QXE86079.1 hypothetical protein KP003_17205 [Geomonas nitrogeniifigens]